jgi:hypothetical protein
MSKYKTIINIEVDAHSISAKRRLVKYIGRVTNNIKRTKKIDNFFFDTPSLAFDYLNNLVAQRDYSTKTKKKKKIQKYISSSYEIIEPEKLRVDQKLEKTFSKNTLYALSYLLLTKQSCFSDPDLNKKIMKRIYSNPNLSFYYSAYILNKRLPEDKEAIFLKDYKAMYHYARIMIEGRFNESIEKKIVLGSFQNEYASASCEKHTFQYTKTDYLKRYLEYIEKDCKINSRNSLGYSNAFSHRDAICWTYLNKMYHRGYYY